MSVFSYFGIQLGTPLNYDAFNGGSIEGIMNGIYENIGNIMGQVLTVMGIVGLIGIVYGALMYSMAGASPDKAGKGKKAITNSIIGTIICGVGTTVLSAIYGIMQAADLNTVITTIVDELAFWVGAVSITMIVYGALLYALGGTNPSNTAKGKQAITMACIGMAIAMLAEAILHFVTNAVGL